MPACVDVFRLVSSNPTFSLFEGPKVKCYGLLYTIDKSNNTDIYHVRGEMLRILLEAPRR